MKNHINFSQLYLRLAIGIGFISAVLDRIGWAGPIGTPNVSWGTWDPFLKYTHALLPFMSKGISDVMALVATIAEVVFGILIIIGFKTRVMAIGSFLLTLVFAICMTLFFGLKSPLNYSVFAVSAGSLLLSAIPEYKWSIDNLLRR